MAFVVLFWAFNFVALKFLYREMEPPTATLIRTALMYASLLVICRLRGESTAYRDPSRTWKLLLLGANTMGVYMVLFMLGMQHSSPSQGAIILAAAPVMTALLAMAVKQERFRIAAIIGAVLGFGGVTLVILAGAERADNTLFGNTLLLASAVLIAVSMVQSRALVVGQSSLVVLTQSMPGGLFVIVPWSIPSLLRTDFASMSGITWLCLAHLTFLSGVLAFTFFYSGVKAVGAPGATLYQFFVPPTTALFAYLLLGKPLHWEQAAGLVVIVLGVWISARGREVITAPSVSSGA